MDDLCQTPVKPKRYTNSSVNSRAKVIYAIYSQPHWYSQLQTAENIIGDRYDAITKNQILLEQQRQLLELRQKTSQSAEEKIVLTADFQLFELDRQKHQDLLQDALMEYQTALAIRNDLVQKHPEVTVDYSRTQALYTEDALAATIALNFSVDFISRQTGLPSGVINSALTMTEQIRQKVCHYDGLNRQKFEAFLQSEASIVPTLSA